MIESRDTELSETRRKDDKTSPRNPKSSIGRSRTDEDPEPTGIIAGSKKVEANRKNAKWSIGPRTVRGKLHSRLNALKHGAFSNLRLLPGEKENAYAQLSTFVFRDAKPKTAIEVMLVDQIVGAIWRLRRLEQAEHAYFRQVQKAALARTIRALTESERKCVSPPIVDKASFSDAEAADLLDNAYCQRAPGVSAAPEEHDFMKDGAQASAASVTKRLVQSKLAAATDVKNLMLDGMVSPSGAFPYFVLDQTRRSLIRDIMRNSSSLSELQGR